MIRKKLMQIKGSKNKRWGAEGMADKELRKLKRRELLQMLLVQCEETERLQQETDEMREQMDTVMESYERLKKKLDVKDERLNQKDEMIARLKCEIEDLKAAAQTQPDTADTVSDVAVRLGEIFEEAQKVMEQYMADAGRSGGKKIPFEHGRPASSRKKASSTRSGQIVPIKLSQAGSDDQDPVSVEQMEEPEMIAAVSGGIYG